jgi:hypothetical protein
MREEANVAQFLRGDPCGKRLVGSPVFQFLSLVDTKIVVVKSGLGSGILVLLLGGILNFLIIVCMG